jgi:hypothetical protein
MGGQAKRVYLAGVFRARCAGYGERLGRSPKSAAGRAAWLLDPRLFPIDPSGGGIEVAG